MGMGLMTRPYGPNSSRHEEQTDDDPRENLQNSPHSPFGPLLYSVDCFQHAAGLIARQGCVV